MVSALVLVDTATMPSIEAGRRAGDARAASGRGATARSPGEESGGEGTIAISSPRFRNERARVLGLARGAAEGDCEGFARLCRGSCCDRRAWARGESVSLLGLGRGGAL